MLNLNAYYPFELCQTYLKYYCSFLACGVSAPRDFGNVTLWGTPLAYLNLELAAGGNISKLTSVPALQHEDPCGFITWKSEALISSVGLI